MFLNIYILIFFKIYLFRINFWNGKNFYLFRIFYILRFFFKNMTIVAWKRRQVYDSTFKLYERIETRLSSIFCESHVCFAIVRCHFFLPTHFLVWIILEKTKIKKLKPLRFLKVFVLLCCWIPKSKSHWGLPWKLASEWRVYEPARFGFL